MPETKSRLSIWAPLAALAVVAFAVALHSRPDRVLEGGPECAVRSATGLHCPGCGTTRAVSHLMRGDIGSALGSNLLVVVIIPLVGYCLLAPLLQAWTKRRLPLPRRRAFWWLLTALFAGFMLLRNLPFEPFSQLAP